MIKYIGSKRRLVPVLGDLARHAGGETALDLFTGTTRVAQELKSKGFVTTAVDTARYSEIFARCYIETDAGDVDRRELAEAIRYLSTLPGDAGYFTHTFCVQSRYFQPFNGERVDAIRNAIEAEFKGTSLYSLLLTSLIEAADRVDSTTGVQMAYVKSWAPRSFNKLELRPPELLRGAGHAVRGDACELAGTLGEFDVAYLDPPYNQHRYFTNYHIWETLVAWDTPEFYGIACKRLDSRDSSTKSVFNLKREMPAALRQVVREVRCRVLMLSYNDEAWVTREELEDMCSHHELVETLAFDSKRYVGAQIGIYNPEGKKVGKVSHLSNLEYVVVAGSQRDVARTTRAYAGRTYPRVGDAQLFDI
ncbi:MAG: DNA adenine methylase [Actinomycetota bacterium]|nr:DNA adenine methylase [Actinomycetota bacterium]